MKFTHITSTFDYSYGHYCECCGNWFYYRGYTCPSCREDERIESLKHFKKENLKKLPRRRYS